MFRHKNSEENKVEEIKTDATPVVLPTEANKMSKKETSLPEPPGLRELIEKNLKWSQIIYEQNRKINNKLLWAAVFSWLKMILIVGPIVLAIIYLQPMLKNVWSQYNQLLGGASAEKGESDQGSLDNFFQLFNLDPAKQEQLKALLK